MKLGLSKTDYPFDYFFAKASSERAAAEECNVGCDDDDDDDDVLSSDSDSELTATTSAVVGPCPPSVSVAVTE